MIVQFPITVSVEVQCEICGRWTMILRTQLNAGDHTPQLRLWEGWRTLNGQVICPDHNILITTEGKEDRRRVNPLRVF